ncbi:hypothetical protein FPOA_03051 [Fusarium poae]|uniref:Uncharacterized protein n=1 Tax=Fusarium poae TaxID=36050 RepID=A0A1B8B8S3_FUSPO|nr:hypothetical protein FPOA_03051 [Fusarium poae]
MHSTSQVVSSGFRDVLGPSPHDGDVISPNVPTDSKHAGCSPMQDFPAETGECYPSIPAAGKQEAGLGKDLTQADEGGPEADHLAGCSLSREAGNKPVAVNQDELMLEQMQSWPY